MLKEKNMKSIAKSFSALVIFVAFVFAGNAVGKVSKEEAEKLKGELTPIGAERAGNAAGTIPAWEGGITKPVEGYKPGDHHPDPFKDDKILFTITADNLGQHKEHLTPGQIALFNAYPKTFKMHVYPSRRSASFPQFVYDAMYENATHSVMNETKNGVHFTKISSPFPIPKDPLEVYYNHYLRFRGASLIKYGGQAAPTRSGSYTVISITEEMYSLYSQRDVTYEDIENMNFFIYFKQKIVSPPRLAGTALLVHEPLDQVKKPRQAWLYNAGQRRVRRAPNIAYDTPGTASDGLRTTDDYDLMNGAPNRYNWTLLGKKEIYVAYNCYELHSDQVKYKDILQPNHVNPDLVRYELHRVWVLEANLKKGTRHIYKRRVLYSDEDSWGFAIAEMYDNRDNLWRVNIAHFINYYEVPVIWSTLDAIHDLQARRYLVMGLDNETKMIEYGKKFDKVDFTPSALRRTGKK